MIDIMMAFACFNQSLHPTALRQLTVVAQALLAMTGRVTMLALSRWKGLRAPVALIGGAGTFDGVFLTGIIAVLLA